MIKEHKGRGLLSFVLILLCFNFFFISINLLGAFKGEGKAYAEFLLVTLKNNPFVGLLIGILVTSIMQSSSATTSIVVSFMAAGMFGNDMPSALYATIPLIMGANIGTSVTNTLVAFGHIGSKEEFIRAGSAATVHDFFNLLVVIVLFPIQVYTNFLGKISIVFANLFSDMGGATFNSPINIVLKPQVAFVQNLFRSSIFLSEIVVYSVMAFILFLLVSALVKQFYDLNKHRKKMYFYALNSFYLALFVIGIKDYSHIITNSSVAILVFAFILLFSSLGFFVKIMRSITSNKVEVLFNNYIFKSPARSFTLGLILTVIVQSSSVTISSLVPLAGAGILSVYQIFPYTLGANIGTTITALLAALALGSVGALSVAFSHVFFNVIGVSIMFPLKKIPIWLSQKFASLINVNRLLPIFLVLIFYIIIPLLGILIFK